MKTLTNQELSQLSISDLQDLNKRCVQVLKSAYTRVQVDAIFKFSVGQRVEFTRDSTNTNYPGIIMKINQKTISVDCGLFGKYKVSPSLLRAAL